MERVSDVATVVASLVAIVAFGVGLGQFSLTQQLARENLRLQAQALDDERESKAVELFLKFNELQQAVANKPLPPKGSAAFWNHNMLLGLTESVFRLTEGDRRWGETVEWMLSVQRPFLEGEPQGCATFADVFVRMMLRAAPDMRCVGVADP